MELTDKNHETSVKITSVRVEICNRDCQNMKQCYPLESEVCIMTVLHVF
jgi:hypothetical protein